MDQDNHSLSKLVAILAASLILGACSLMAPSRTSPSPSLPPASSSAPPSPPSAPPPPSPYQPPAHPQQPARENHLSPATHSLVTQARNQVAHGDLPAASSTLDRALRIEPNNPLLWIELGRLRLAENDAHQAEGCARKALALASGDRATQAQSGRLLADALRTQSRNQEARDVESQPFMK
jgi:tetratricopeptide (TPR) repeat protein